MGKNTVEEVIISATGEKMRIKDKLTRGRKSHVCVSVPKECV